jgi:hypothetical protein
MSMTIVSDGSGESRPATASYEARTAQQAQVPRRAADRPRRTKYIPAGPHKKNVLKVIGFRPDKELAEKIQQALLILDVSPSELAREAYAMGLEPAVRNIAECQRLVAIKTLKRLKKAKAKIHHRPFGELNR